MLAKANESLGEMNNPTFKIRRGKELLLNFSKSVIHVVFFKTVPWKKKMFPAFVIYLLFQVDPFALKPPGTFIYLSVHKSPAFVFRRDR